MAAVLRFDAVLADFPEVRRSIELRQDQTLVDLHEGIQAAFGWLDDHIYSFWLDGEFWGSPATEYTAPVEVEDDVATADVVLSRLGLKQGAKVAYVFDFGDNWRVSLRLDARIDDEGVNYPRVVAGEGDAPPQYPAPDEDVATADVPVGELGLNPGAEIAYVFDFGDSWRVSLRLTETARGEETRYPRVVAAQGEAPPQYPDADADEDEDEDEEVWLREWEAADRHAAEVVIRALSHARGAETPEDALAAAAGQLRAGLSANQYPFSWIGKAAGLDANATSDDEELVLRGVAATISPVEETGLDPEDEASIMALEHGDWAGAVIELCRRGPGVSAEPAALVEAIEDCPEIAGPPSDPGDAVVAEAAFELVGFAWEAAGMLDDRRALTPLGVWALPRALTRAWGVDFDSAQVQES